MICDKCGRTIPGFEHYITCNVKLTTGQMSHTKYCQVCCEDTTMAVLFFDVLRQPVERIVVRKKKGQALDDYLKDGALK